MPNTFIEMTEEEWFNTYKPIENHLDTNSSFDGHMFETYGSEVAFVKSQSPDKIWMFGDGDDGGLYIWSGWGFVNRLGYFITEVPCPENTTIQIMVAEPDLTCDFCGDTLDEEEAHDCEGINQ
jgi:hypothetical protein